MKAKISTILFVIIIIMGNISLSHSGRTDSSGGHNDRSTGEYHYHHGYSAHDHIDGVCPYEEDTEEYVVSDEVSSTDTDVDSTIIDLRTEIENKEESIDKLNNTIKEKNNEIESLETDKSNMHFIYISIIVILGIWIAVLKSNQEN